ncbi:hypothetical protein [Parabacteroides sp.]
MDFKAITQLKLKQAFANELKFEKVIDIKDFLDELFEYGNKGTLFVYDDRDVGHSIFVEDTNGIGRDRVFVVCNKDHKDVFLWHIDGVLFQKDSKCDCAVLTDDSIDFVEFKTFASNVTMNAVEDNYKKACSQLLLTLKEVSEKCKSVGVDLRTVVKVNAFAVFNRTVPRNSASQKKMAAKFLLDSEGVKLYFKNERSF